MSYLKLIRINTDKTQPFPYNIPAIKYANHIEFNSSITFLVGENATGKSTLLETIACRLQLPHMDGSGYQKKCFDAAKTLLQYLELEWPKKRSIGFFLGQKTSEIS